MPGDKKHHTAKFRSCVEKVMAQGRESDAAYAICTTALQKAGDPIFEGAASRSAEEMRMLETLIAPPVLVFHEIHRTPPMYHLHLCGATGRSRTEMLDGREYLVVPVVALMEGVIHAVNASTPEFVPLATLRRGAASWNGRPVVLGHPTKDGRQCSANAPDIEASHRIGTIYNSRVEGMKLLQEAWIEKAKAKRLHPEMYERLAADKTEEVSVGAFVITNGQPGEFNGKRYTASWIDTTGDHLAFLPGGRGACSVEMGCGTHRAAAMHQVLAEEITVLKTKLEDCPICKGAGNVNGNPCEACDSHGEVKAAAERIRQEGGKWLLYSTNGSRKLAEHGSRRDAEAHAAAIDAAITRRTA